MTNGHISPIKVPFSVKIGFWQPGNAHLFPDIPNSLFNVGTDGVIVSLPNSQQS